VLAFAGAIAHPQRGPALIGDSVDGKPRRRGTESRLRLEPGAKDRRDRQSGYRGKRPEDWSTPHREQLLVAMKDR
jgi:hypothetical protein